MENKTKNLKKYYSLLKGIEESAKIYVERIPEKIVSKYNNLIDKIIEETEEDLILDYKITDDQLHDYNMFSTYERYCCEDDFFANIWPVIKLLEENYKEDDISKVGTLYSSIDDEELKERCLDILSGKSKFDRVINQATQVLEDRIKKKAGLVNEKIVGNALVCKAISAKKEEPILLFSDKPEIQECFSMFYKGVIGVYRNQTHHTTDYVCTREEALKCCAFIDCLLKELAMSKILIKTN